MHILTIASQKGGTGKTTIATSLAVAAMQEGEQVVMFELDPQGSLLEWRDARAAEVPRVEAFPLAKVAQLGKLLQSLAGRYSLVVVDTPGTDNTPTHLAMEAADLCLVPLTPTRMDYKATKPTVQALLRGGTPFAFVLNKCPPQPNNTRAAEMQRSLSVVGTVAPTFLALRVDYQDAYAAGQGATEFAPDGKAADDARALWRWVRTQLKGTPA